eukprot:TRINITY_DN7825_c0_g1_i1.p1 TRINITY_DN7825_c0_g1~~TRINITY_DN7825_c0_g1_i1.p1  ORF type:complete len:512 (+),score=103.92 TRINITY_DN7825_c0_g1_i1:36-1571(+)
MAAAEEQVAPPPSGLQYMQSAKQELKNSVGTEACWGWSPSFDILEHIPAAHLDGDIEEPVNILLDNPGDPRHILETMSKVKRHTDRPVHFYVYEANLKNLARHTFFLTWFFEQSDLSALEEKCAEFLEIYGNTLLRDTAYTALKRISKKAAEVVRGGTKEKLSGVIDFETFIKMKECDWVAEQLDAWSSDKSTFKADTQWDSRIRNDVGDRYDSRTNMMDWDFNTNFLPYSSHLRWPEYKDWRQLGIAYDWGRVNPHRETRYDYKNPNKSLATFIGRKRDNGVYLGDIRSGPFACLGIDTQWGELAGKQHDGSFKYSNGLIALHNLRSWLYERLTGDKWQYSEFKAAWDAPTYKQPQKVEVLESVPDLPKFKVFMCGIDPARLHLLLNTKLEAPVRFDAMYVSCQGAQNATPERLALMKPTGYVAIETLKYCVFMEYEKKLAYIQKVNEIIGESAAWVHAPTLTRSFHKHQPAFSLPFTKEGSKLTEAQEKQKEKFISPCILAFTRNEPSG